MHNDLLLQFNYFFVNFLFHLLFIFDEPVNTVDRKSRCRDQQYGAYKR